MIKTNGPIKRRKFSTKSFILAESRNFSAKVSLGYVQTKNLPNRKEIELQYLGQYLETTGVQKHIDGDRVGITNKQGTKAKSTRIVEYVLNGTHRLNHLQITIKTL